MDAIQLLKQDHEKARQMFTQILQGSPEQRTALWKQLKPELELHEQLEEIAVYGPVARSAQANDRLKEWNDHHHAEVAEAEALIEEISSLEATDDEWLAKIEELQETLELHIEEEEGDIWPQIQQAWDREKLAEAGQKIEALKHENKAA
jgi:hypothetical protein